MTLQYDPPPLAQNALPVGASSTLERHGHGVANFLLLPHSSIVQDNRLRIAMAVDDNQELRFSPRRQLARLDEHHLIRPSLGQSDMLIPDDQERLD